MTSPIIVSGLSDIESLFSRLESGEDIHISQLELNIFNAVNFKIYGDPARYNGTLPASLAQGLCEFQTEIYKVYTLIRYKTDNLQKLTSKDRENAEVVFTIDSGCTEIIAAMKELFEAFGTAFEKVTHGMSPKQKTLCFLFAITVLGGAWIGTSYLDHSTEVSSQQEETKQIHEKNETENERLNILKNGMLEAIRTTSGVDAIERAEGIQEHTAKAYAGVLKGASDADRIKISGISKVDLSQNDVHDIIKNPTPKAKNEEKNLEVSIDGIKRSLDKLTLSCHEPDSDESFPVSIVITFVSDDEISLIFDAMKNNTTIKIQGTYKTRDGVIEQGNGSSVSKP